MAINMSNYDITCPGHDMSFIEKTLCNSVTRSYRSSLFKRFNLTDNVEKN